MSEERDIEKKLRAFADKRRKDAGGPFELHPATRRLLQGEAARQQGESARKPPPGNFLEKMFFLPLPRLTWVLSALAILAAGTWVFLGTLPKSKEFAANSETAGFVQGAATLAKEAGSAGGDLGDRTVTVAAAPAPAAPPAPVAVVMKGGTVGQQSYNFRNNYAVAATGGKADGPAGGDFKKSPDEAKTKRANQAVLMDSFQFEQAGEQVRIVDNDGSVYTGKLVAAEKVSLIKKSAESNTPNQSFRFTVTGTNRSWNQRVAITGEVLNAGNLVVNSVTNQPGTQSSVLGQSQINFNNSFLMSNGRIIGRVVAADGREVELNATQVSP